MPPSLLPWLRRQQAKRRSEGPQTTVFFPRPFRPQTSDRPSIPLLYSLLHISPPLTSSSPRITTSNHKTPLSDANTAPESTSVQQALPSLEKEKEREREKREARKVKGCERNREADRQADRERERKADRYLFLCFPLHREIIDKEEREEEN